MLMPKRFTDTEKWRDEWWGSLSNDYRMIWLYLLDSCSIAGIWKKDFRGLNFNCNVNIDEPKFKELFSGRVIDLGNSFFIPKFLRFQYPKGLNSNKPAIISVLKELRLNNLLPTVSELLGNDYLIIKDKDKDKDKDKRKEKDKDEDKEQSVLFDFTKPDIPGDIIVLPIDTEATRKLWAAWKESRWHNHKARYKMHGEKAEAAKLQGLDFNQIKATIEASIAGGWKNLHITTNNHKNGKSVNNRQQRNQAAREYLADYYGSDAPGKQDS